MKNKAYLVCVDGQSNHNKYYEAVLNDDDSIDVNYGRVGSSNTYHHYYPYEKNFYSLIDSKVRKGYKDITETHYQKGVDTPKQTQIFNAIPDKYVGAFVKEMFSRQLEIVRANYRDVKGVTKATVLKAREYLDDLEKRYQFYKSNPNAVIYHRDINDILTNLFTVMPRIMSDPSSYMLRSGGTIDNIKKIIERETKILDSAQIVADRADVVGNEQGDADVLKKFGIEIKSISYAEEDMIAGRLGEAFNRYKSAYAVTNFKTDKGLQDTLSMKTGEHKKTSLLCHGSPSKNWWSIVTNGLSIGKSRDGMFGCGLYFAPKAQKSAGYMDTRSSYWRSGSAETGFLGLYEVNTGVPYEVSRTSSELRGSAGHIQSYLSNRGYDCVWAKEGQQLRNDEVIVYDEKHIQSNLKYIVELYDTARPLTYRMSKFDAQDKQELKEAFYGLKKEGNIVTAQLSTDKMSGFLKQKLSDGIGETCLNELLFKIDTDADRMDVVIGDRKADMLNGDLKFLMGQMKRAFFKSEKEFRDFAEEQTKVTFKEKDIRKVSGEER